MRNDTWNDSNENHSTEQLMNWKKRKSKSENRENAMVEQWHGWSWMILLIGMVWCDEWMIPTG